MLIEVMKSKICYAKVTETKLEYNGSITIDASWMDCVGLYENEKVQIVNLENGERIETYVIKGYRDSQCICLNGPAARRFMVGDRVHIIAYGYVELNAPQYSPKILNLKEV